MGLAVLMVSIGISHFILPFHRIVYEDHWLDSPLTQHPSLSDPTTLVSSRFPQPTARQLETPVVIAVHGFSATAFEWAELAEFAEKTGRALVSRVTLGGHGTHIQAFKQSGWQDWMAPILQEYLNLVQKGYRDIRFIGSSTGGTLLLKAIFEGHFKSYPPTQLMLIDTLIVPYDKTLYWVNWIGWALGSQPPDPSTRDQDRIHGYSNLPASSLSSLLDLIRQVERLLEAGIKVPDQTQISVYQSRQDQVVDPVSGQLIDQGLVVSDPTKKTWTMVDSDRHVFTQQQTPPPVSDRLQRAQKEVFMKITSP